MKVMKNFAHTRTGKVNPVIFKIGICIKNVRIFFKRTDYYDIPFSDTRVFLIYIKIAAAAFYVNNLIIRPALFTVRSDIGIGFFKITEAVHFKIVFGLPVAAFFAV